VDFVDASIVGLDPGLSIVALKPNSLQVELEPQAERPVRLQASVVGEAADGFRLAKVTLEPGEVTVVGPTSVVATLDKVMTRALVIDGLSQDTEREISLDLPPPLMLKKPGVILASLRIQAVNSTRTFTDVPVVCRDPGWRPVQDSVSVVLEGPVRELSALEVDALTVMVVLPGDLERAPLSVGVALAPEARLEIVHPGGDTLQLATLEPAKIDVEPIAQ
jgi:YbbR domain-containing protein